jgi:hypothetical protein
MFRSVDEYTLPWMMTSAVVAALASARMSK